MLDYLHLQQRLVRTYAPKTPNSPFPQPFVTARVGSLLEVLKPEVQVPDFSPEPDRVHVSNGTLLLDGTFLPGKPHIVRNRLPVAYNPGAKQPERWLSFLNDLLYPEDIPTLQEFLGYCLIPSNAGQKMLILKGSCGEGKSQIGAVLASIFRNNMKDGSIAKISENPFARADLEHTLLMVDDDMRLDALRQTNYVKSIVTAQGKMDLERKGKQSYQGWILICYFHCNQDIFLSLLRRWKLCPLRNHLLPSSLPFQDIFYRHC